VTTIAQRAGSVLVVIWLASTLAFFALRAVPGDAIEAQLVQSGVNRDVIEQRRAEQGLTEPIGIQYIRFLGGILRGDLGRSLISGQSVSELIAQHIVPTAALAINALIVASVAGLLLGVLGALELRGGFSILARGVVALSLSTPAYWTGTLAIYIFSAQLGVLPSAGAGRLSQLILPIAVLGFHTAGAIARVVQASVRETLEAEFVQVARAKGLSERAIIWRHVLRASLLPVVTVIALQAGFLLSGTVIVESLFVRPGIGRLLLDSVMRQDYPVVQGIVIFAAIVYALLNMVADTLYRIVDPRVAL
jgi:peptide/nickel transport system permease protein